MCDDQKKVLIVAVINLFTLNVLLQPYDDEAELINRSRFLKYCISNPEYLLEVEKGIAEKNKHLLEVEKGIAKKNKP